MEKKFTQGPWESDGFEIYGNNGRDFIADIFDESENRKANAKLIATAPEMLEVIEMLLNCPALNMDDLESADIEVIEFANQVIKKALS